MVTEGRLGGAGLPVGDSAGFHAGLNTQGIRTAQYAYIRYNDGQSELYDLAMDPNEMHNVAGDPEYAAVRSVLDAAWWSYTDCAADACTVPLPAELQASPGRERDLALSFWAAVHARYGT